jgi:hypothetical protein
LDDFGTGYSSHSYLRSFPSDVIKIDRIFISEMDTRDDYVTIVSAIVDLAGRLGMETTAKEWRPRNSFSLRGSSVVHSCKDLCRRPQPVGKAVKRSTDQLREARAAGFTETVDPSRRPRHCSWRYQL